MIKQCVLLGATMLCMVLKLTAQTEKGASFIGGGLTYANEVNYVQQNNQEKATNSVAAVSVSFAKAYQNNRF